MAFSLFHSILCFSLLVIICHFLLWCCLIQKLRLKPWSESNLNNLIPFLCILRICLTSFPDRQLFFFFPYFAFWNSWLVVSFIVNLFYTHSVFLPLEEETFLKFREERKSNEVLYWKIFSLQWRWFRFGIDITIKFVLGLVC